MKKPFILSLILLSSTFIFSQVIHLDIKNKKINEFLNYEKTTGSQKLENQGTNYPYKPVEQPIKFIQKQKIVPSLLTEYSFFKGDSLTESRTYNWKAEKNTAITDSIFIKAMISKYDSLDKYITSKIGKGNSEGNLDDLYLIEHRGGLEKTIKWFSSDSIEVRLYLTLCNYSEIEKTSFATVTTPTSHRIYLVVENKSKRPQSKIKPESELKNIANSFFTDMINENYENAINYFGSGLMSQTYSKSDLNKINNKIKPNKGMNFVNSFSMTVGLEDHFMFLSYSNYNNQLVKLIFNSVSGKLLAVE